MARREGRGGSHARGVARRAEGGEGCEGGSVVLYTSAIHILQYGRGWQAG